MGPWATAAKPCCRGVKRTTQCGHTDLAWPLDGPVYITKGKAGSSDLQGRRGKRGAFAGPQSAGTRHRCPGASHSSRSDLRGEMRAAVFTCTQSPGGEHEARAFTVCIFEVS